MTDLTSKAMTDLTSKAMTDLTSKMTALMCEELQTDITIELFMAIIAHYKGLKDLIPLLKKTVTTGKAEEERDVFEYKVSIPQNTTFQDIIDKIANSEEAVKVAELNAQNTGDEDKRIREIEPKVDGKINNYSPYVLCQYLKNYKPEAAGATGGVVPRPDGDAAADGDALRTAAITAADTLVGKLINEQNPPLVDVQEGKLDNLAQYINLIRSVKYVLRSESENPSKVKLAAYLTGLVTPINAKLNDALAAAMTALENEKAATSGTPAQPLPAAEVAKVDALIEALEAAITQETTAVIYKLQSEGGQTDTGLKKGFDATAEFDPTNPLAQLSKMIFKDDLSDNEGDGDDLKSAVRAAAGIAAEDAAAEDDDEGDGQEGGRKSKNLSRKKRSRSRRR